MPIDILFYPLSLAVIDVQKNLADFLSILDRNGGLGLS
jgi:hypothetical protein